MKEKARNAFLLASGVLNSPGCEGRQVGKALYGGFQSCTNKNPFESDGTYQKQFKSSLNYNRNKLGLYQEV